ncbi:MAG: TonB-dependent receptor plug domain-containing protein [Chitinophagaceae bacterium]
MLLYLIKLSISLAVVTTFYWMVLRKLTFYKWNRWYLLGYSLLSFLLPFLNVYDFLEPGTTGPVVMEAVPLLDLEQLRMLMGREEDTSLFSDPLRLAGVLLFAGMIFFIGRLILNVSSFLLMKRKAVLLQDGPVKVFALPDGSAHFSFGNNIFINPASHTDGELQRILLHEYVHVRQKHTFDLLLAEFLCLVMWFNPFAWLLRRAIRQNLEFLADEEVLKQGIAPKEYQLLLLKVMSGLPHRFVAPFGFSFLKKRIAMMNKNKTARVHAVRFLFVLPLMAATVLSFRSMAGMQPPPAPPAMDVPAPPPPPVEFSGEDPFSDFFRRNPQVKYVSMKSPDGEVVVTLKSGKKEVYDFANATQKEAFTKKYGKYVPPPPPPPPPVQNRKMPAPPAPPKVSGDTIAPKLKGEVRNIKVSNRALNETFSHDDKVDASLDQLKVSESQGKTGHLGSTKIMVRGTNDTTKKPLFVIDGVPAKDDFKLETIVPDDIEEISILKDASATALYGEKGKNGVILITTKKNKGAVQEKVVVGYRTTPSKGVVVVDAKNQAKEEVVVEGYKKTTPAATGKEKVVIVEGYKKTTDADPKNIILNNGGQPVNALVVYNGKEYTVKDFQALNVDPDTIESIDVFKNEAAIAKYGDKGKNGVIVIKSK